MITYNRCAEVLRSLGNLTQLPERPAIIVVDNGSSDDTVAAIGAQYPLVRVIAAGKNLGPPGEFGCGRGIDALRRAVRRRHLVASRSVAASGESF